MMIELYYKLNAIRNLLEEVCTMEELIIMLSRLCMLWDLKPMIIARLRSRKAYKSIWC